MQYLCNPDLPFISNAPSGWRGNPFVGKEFQYVRDSFKPDWTALLRMVFSPNPQRQEKKRDVWVPPVNAATAYLDDRTENWMVWLGHASYLIQVNGVRLLTDPQLTDMPMVPRRVFPPFSYEDIRGVDYLLLSHDHRDHVDEKCIRSIAKNNNLRKILCPLKLSSVIGDWVGDCPIEEAGWYQQYGMEHTGLEVTFLPAQHWCRRGLTDFNRVLWGSFMIEVGADAGASKNQDAMGGAAARTIYFGGDSAATSYWAEIGHLYPTIDVCMLGIGAYAPDYMMQEVHADPDEAFAGYQDLGARYWWPMHHGTYDLSNEPASEPIRRATSRMQEAGIAERLVQPPLNQPWWFTDSTELGETFG